MAPRSAQTAEKRSKLVHGAQRAKAWVHMVINPLLESLPIEVSFLERGNTTWRHNNRRLELIRTVEIYLAPDARHVLRDYLRANPRNKRHFNRHDDLLTEIVEAATLAHSALLANPGFQDELATATRSFGIAEPGRVAQADSASSYITADLIAERVVNKVETLPTYYVDSKFWESHGSRFRRFATGPAFDKLDSKRLALLDHDRRFVDWLERTSFELCSRYDIPAAPLPNSEE